MLKKQSKETVFQMLEALEVPKTGLLLVHSAFKGFSREGYDADEMLIALVEYMNDGSLFLPAMSWRFVKKENPFFDELKTPTNTGILCQKFLERYAKRRSLHPTHSISGVGKEVNEILGTHHECTTPCGEKSPFSKLAKLDGRIIMMGVGIDCCTVIHSGEEKAAPSYYVEPEKNMEKYTCTDRNGKKYSVNLRRHRFLPRNYWQFQDLLASRKQLKIFRMDNSICIGFSAKVMKETVEEVLYEKPDAIIAKTGQRYRLM